MAALVLSACAATSVPSGSAPTGGTSSSPTSVESGGPRTLDSSYPSGETLIGQLSSQRGINEIGPFPVTSSSVYVYVRCLGQGTVNVEVAGVASFGNDCSTDASDLGTENELDVRFVKTISVRVTGDNSLLWALAVTAPQS